MSEKDIQRYARTKPYGKSLSKSQRDKILIDSYINFIQPKLNSEHFPKLTEEDITKEKARAAWDAKFKEEFLQSGMLKRDFEKIFEKANGPRPKSLVSQEGWFLISDEKEKDVFNVHYSFGFDDGAELSFWVEIALNSVASVEQFLSMNEEEIKEFFELSKSKPPRMVLELTEKKKTNYASSTVHTTQIEQSMSRLTLDDIKKVRIKANEIRNNPDSLIQPFIGLCVVRFVKQEELAENFSLMEDVFDFISSLVPRRERFKNTLREQKQLESKRNDLEAKLTHLRKVTGFFKGLGKFDEQEQAEKEIDRIEQEIKDIDNALEENEDLIHNLEEDMGGKIR